MKKEQEEKDPPTTTQSVAPTPAQSLSSAPSMATISTTVDNPLFDQLCRYLEAEYSVEPKVEFSQCSMQYGWNVKYKKSGRSLCTLYPMEGYFIALVVIGSREEGEMTLTLPLLSDYLQNLYHETKSCMNQKWLMINVTNEATLEDVKHCIAIRRGKKK